MGKESYQELSEATPLGRKIYKEYKSLCGKRELEKGLCEKLQGFKDKWRNTDIEFSDKDFNFEKWSEARKCCYSDFSFKFEYKGWRCSVSLAKEEESLLLNSFSASTYEREVISDMAKALESIYGEFSCYAWFDNIKVYFSHDPASIRLESSFVRKLTADNEDRLVCSETDLYFEPNKVKVQAKNMKLSAHELEEFFNKLEKIIKKSS